MTGRTINPTPLGAVYIAYVSLEVNKISLSLLFNLFSRLKVRSIHSSAIISLDKLLSHDKSPYAKRLICINLCPVQLLSIPTNPTAHIPELSTNGEFFLINSLTVPGVSSYLQLKSNASFQTGT